MTQTGPATDLSVELEAVLGTGLDKVVAGLCVDGGWISLVHGETLDLACHRGISDAYAATIASRSL